MNFNRSLRQTLSAFYKNMRDGFPVMLEQMGKNPHLFLKLLDPPRGLNTPLDVMQEWELEELEFSMAYTFLQSAKTIVFAKEQAEVFLKLPSSYGDPLDFRLPFPTVFMQFDQPIEIPMDDGPDFLAALIFNQYVQSEEDLALAQKHETARKALIPTGLSLISTTPGDTINHLIAVFSDMNLRKLSWTSQYTHTFFEASDNQGIMRGWTAIRNLAIATIAYINCENVSLHLEDNVPPKVNAKRLRDGKKILEPYYLCRIRGVQYDSSGNPTGEGSHHGFRYDVRGHFRRLDSGKTTWVRPHQRGLQNELYVPKTYLVKGSNP